MQTSRETTGKFLRERLAQQMEKNPAYSLRAMARNLSTSPSYVSEIMHGKSNYLMTRLWILLVVWRSPQMKLSTFARLRSLRVRQRSP